MTSLHSYRAHLKRVQIVPNNLLVLFSPLVQKSPTVCLDQNDPSQATLRTHKTKTQR